MTEAPQKDASAQAATGQLASVKRSLDKLWGVVRAIAKNAPSPEIEVAMGEDLNADGVVGRRQKRKGQKEGKGRIVVFALLGLLLIAGALVAGEVIDGLYRGHAVYGTWLVESADGVATILVDRVWCDQIEEKTAAGGIELDKVLLKDGEVFDSAAGFWDAAPIARATMSNHYEYAADFLYQTTNTASPAPAGWALTGDAGYDVLFAAGRGGVWKLASDTNDNDEVYCQLGELRTEACFAMTNDAKEVWFECYVKCTDTNAVTSVFFGLAEAASAAANFLVDSNGRPATNKAAVGFSVHEGTNQNWHGIVQVEGAEANDRTEVNLGTNGETWQRLAFHFDGSETLTWYYNDAANATTVSFTNGVAPIGVLMNPIIGVKVGAAYASDSTDCAIELDWVKILEER